MNEILIIPNILIVHYNTPYLTSYLVKSIKKYTPSARIYIFDNSDKQPFVSEYEDITIFDNTKGDYIDFDEFLSNEIVKDLVLSPRPLSKIVNNGKI